MNILIESKTGKKSIVLKGMSRQIPKYTRSREG